MEKSPASMAAMALKRRKSRRFITEIIISSLYVYAAASALPFPQRGRNSGAAQQGPRAACLPAPFARGAAFRAVRMRDARPGSDNREYAFLIL